MSESEEVLFYKEVIRRLNAVRPVMAANTWDSAYGIQKILIAPTLGDFKILDAVKSTIGCPLFYAFENNSTNRLKVDSPKFKKENNVLICNEFEFLKHKQSPNSRLLFNWVLLDFLAEQHSVAYIQDTIKKSVSYCKMEGLGVIVAFLKEEDYNKMGNKFFAHDWVNKNVTNSGLLFEMGFENLVAMVITTDSFQYLLKKCKTVEDMISLVCSSGKCETNSMLMDLVRYWINSATGKEVNHKFDEHMETITKKYSNIFAYLRSVAVVSQEKSDQLTKWFESNYNKLCHQ